MRFALACMCVCVLALLPALVAAVPIPYYNCGSASDHIHITTAEADVWSVPMPCHPSGWTRAISAPPIELR
jgi:hypothetical protein